MSLRCCLLLCCCGWCLPSVSRAYKRREGQAPKGLQSFIEPLVVFLMDEVIKPVVGPKYAQHAPLLLSLFFFILVLNLLGLVPFFPGSANVTGHIAVTVTLSAIVFIVTHVNSKAAYWKHMLWMPEVPVPLKIFLAPIEIFWPFLPSLGLYSFVYLPI